MTPSRPSGKVVDDRIATIQDYLKDIRHDLSEIRRLIQDELEALREREFWRDYGQNYQQE